MMNVKNVMLVICLIATFTACKKDENPVIVIPPSEGNERVTFNGIAGSEAGTSAGNSVYLDLSGDKTTAVLRSGWDLGFFSGADFRVILNNTTSAGAKVLNKFDLASVTAADTIGLSLATSQMKPSPSHWDFFDDLEGDLNKTVIPAVSATAASNPVIILNRGTGGGIAARPWIKLRVLRNGNGYTVQYAGILETTFKTIDISKNEDHHFQFVSFENGLVNVEPEKTKWDLVWSYSVFQTNFGDGLVPYNFSDLIAVNYLSGVQVRENVYDDENIASAAYTAFSKDSLATNPVKTGRWTIAGNWRATQPAIGSRPDRFYIIKDAEGNYYKFKSISMGAGTDGGTRGKPEFKYALIK